MGRLGGSVGGFSGRKKRKEEDGRKKTVCL
jgi:hypothetical protein